MSGWMSMRRTRGGGGRAPDRLASLLQVRKTRPKKWILDFELELVVRSYDIDHDTIAPGTDVL
jgi:hypothetical protein